MVLEKVITIWNNILFLKIISFLKHPNLPQNSVTSLLWSPPKGTNPFLKRFIPFN